MLLRELYLAMAVLLLENHFYGLLQQVRTLGNHLRRLHVLHHEVPAFCDPSDCLTRHETQDLSPGQRSCAATRLRFFR